MRTENAHTPNPRRVAAGRRNRAKRRGLSEAGRQRLREAAIANQPWLHSTGPRTPQGKAIAAANGSWRQKGQHSTRELQAEVADAVGLMDALRQARKLALEQGKVSDDMPPATNGDASTAGKIRVDLSPCSSRP